MRAKQITLPQYFLFQGLGMYFCAVISWLLIPNVRTDVYRNWKSYLIGNEIWFLFFGFLFLFFALFYLLLPRLINRQLNFRLGLLHGIGNMSAVFLLMWPFGFYQDFDVNTINEEAVKLHSMFGFVFLSRFGFPGICVFIVA
jgi:heme/copper-type cytochrome/quinol oxidase subunit 1